MKVIGKDMFCRDHISDILIKNNLTKEEANKLVAEMEIKDNGPFASRSYYAVEDDYELYEWEP